MAAEPVGNQSQAYDSSTNYEEFKDVFDYFDKDKSGSIDIKELSHLLKSLGENPNPSELKAMIDALDTDGNGAIEWNEFCTMMLSKRVEITPEEEIKKVFDKFDKDHTNLITKEGILMVMKEVFPNDPVTEEDAQYMIKVANPEEGAESITLEQFSKIMLHPFE